MGAKRKRPANEARMRKAFAAAISAGSPDAPNHAAGARAVHSQRQQVYEWRQKHPELYEEVAAQVKVELQKVAPDMIAKLAKIAQLAADFQLKALQDCFDEDGELTNVPVYAKGTKVIIGYRTHESLRDVVGAGGQAIEKSQLLQGKRTGNETELNLQFTFGQENLQPTLPIPQPPVNRIKKIL